MIVREPVVAGQFYPADRDACLQQLVALLEDAEAPVEQGTARYVGGLVPHAGWMCSGRVAARVFRVLAAQEPPRVIVMLSGVHRYRGRQAALFGTGRWETPLGPVAIDSRLAERILGHTNLIVDDPYAHEAEHSLEVQMPFVRHLFPDIPIVPIMIPIDPRASEVGDAVGRTIKTFNYNALVIGTTDLTHYGPRYGFTPEGVGTKGNTWAKVENDSRFVDLLCAMRSEDLVPEAAAHKNACNSGAAAATVTAARVLGASRGLLLEHTTSGEILAEDTAEQPSDSVGYAGVVFA